MAKIAIVYFSANGHTEQLAHAISDGVKSQSGAEPVVLAVQSSDITNGRWKNDSVIASLQQADTIVFGTPTYMGGYAAQFKSFLDACSSIWYSQGWKDKMAAGFTHSLGLSGDKLNTLNSLMVNAMQHGMVWVGNAVMTNSNSVEGLNRLTSYSGLMAQSNMDQPNIGPGDRQTAVLFGERIAQATLRWTQK
ncbi:p-benzoquinone reductase [Pirellula sp. SH-Sr6A]|uniref:flavodoxin family protein n=1 Tax=Pirellula sp. SH-Sr6A TaxID=1632865 RepID=UPI00078D1517|nr:flavodoxin family protein [Pirellula sp. SH-Sr6A]AMV32788.1 p-benzoquinone reductase [Pirellula sp. SH-Sr6A]